ncbi:hypothetical protein SNEBB_001263 [Seison nebaliae]|nr:hypothetical protein SNEBB_001263 [Seison nebaliae]
MNSRYPYTSNYYQQPYSSTTYQPTVNTQPNPVPDVQLPDELSNELRRKNHSELQQLYDNTNERNNLLERFLTNDIAEEESRLKQNIITKTIDNLENEQNYENNRNQLLLAIDALNEQKEELQTVFKQQNNQMNDNSSDSLYALLRSASTSDEDRTEEMVESFLSSADDTISERELFIEEYIRQRTRAYLLRFKADYLQENQRNHFTTTNPYNDYQSNSMNTSKSYQKVSFE